MRVLVVDDSKETCEFLARSLGRVSHGVKCVRTCSEAETALAVSRFDVVILDVVLPDGSGVDLCARVRAAGLAVPILLLTGRGHVKHRVLGLEAGADDYLPKPFAISELRARINALGRRGPLRGKHTVSCGPVTVDFQARRVHVDGQALALTAHEFGIVSQLASVPGAVVARDELIESVWGEVTGSARASLDVLIARIRRKFGHAAELLQTVRGIGYSLKAAQ